MKPKKNPNADLKKRTGLFFSIGLALATFASLYALNYHSADKEKEKIDLKKTCRSYRRCEGLHYGREHSSSRSSS